jgi:hypothetical protein
MFIHERGVNSLYCFQMSYVEQELLTLSEHLGSLPVHVDRTLVFCVMFCRSLFVILCFFFWPLFCMSFDLRLLIMPLISSNLFMYIKLKSLYCMHVYSRMWRHTHCILFICIHESDVYLLYQFHEYSRTWR